MDNKKSFILYLDALSVLDELDDKQAGKLFRAIKAYQLRSAERCEQDADTGFESLMEDFVTRIAFAPFKAQFERDSQKYNDYVDKKSEAGKKGGGNPNFKKGQPNPYYINKDNQNIIKDNQTLSEINKDNQRLTEINLNVNVSDNDNYSNNVIIAERESHAHTHTREEENTQNEKNEFSSEAERYAQMDNESFFLELWKKARMFYLKQETNYPKLSFVQKQNLEIILKDFTRRELWEGIHGLMIQDVSDLNGGNAMKLTPDHILRYENFTKYLNAGKTNQQLYVKNQPPKQPKRPKREVGDL